MVDYYQLIARAVAGFHKNTDEARRAAIYEHARGALVIQLCSLTPPLTESEITRERLSLDKAIRKIEAEVVHGPQAEAAHPAPAPNAPKQPQPEPLSSEQDGPPAAGRRPSPDGPRSEAKRDETSTAGQKSDAESRAALSRRSLPSVEVLKIFREGVAEAERLSEAEIPGRQAYARPYNVPDLDRFEPGIEPRGQSMRALVKIYAFEPVPTTFGKLAQSVQRLGLAGRVEPVAAAVLDAPGAVQMSWSDKNSLHAQVTPHGLNARAGDHLTCAAGITLDAFCASAGVYPSLVKIDVEGSEAAVLRGPARLLARSDRPAILFEFNPVTLAECDADADTLAALLVGYTLHYVDDLRGQMLPFSTPVDDLRKIDWICNLFAVPRVDAATRRWASVSREVQDRIAPVASLASRLGSPGQP